MRVDWPVCQPPWHQARETDVFVVAIMRLGRNEVLKTNIVIPQVDTAPLNSRTNPLNKTNIK